MKRMPSNSGRTSKIRMYSVLMILSIIHATIPFTPSSVPVNVGNVDLRKIPHFNVWTGKVQDVEKDVEVRLAMNTFNNVFGDNVFGIRKNGKVKLMNIDLQFLLSKNPRKI